MAQALFLPNRCVCCRLTQALFSSHGVCSRLAQAQFSSHGVCSRLTHCSSSCTWCLFLTDTSTSLVMWCLLQTGASSVLGACCLRKLCSHQPVLFVADWHKFCSQCLLSKEALFSSTSTVCCRLAQATVIQPPNSWRCPAALSNLHRALLNPGTSAVCVGWSLKATSCASSTLSCST